MGVNTNGGARVSGKEIGFLKGCCAGKSMFFLVVKKKLQNFLLFVRKFSVDFHSLSKFTCANIKVALN